MIVPHLCLHLLTLQQVKLLTNLHLIVI